MVTSTAQEALLKLESSKDLVCLQQVLSVFYF